MFTQFKQLTWKASILSTIISLLAFSIALAAPGDLDTTFSGDGKVITDISGGQDDSIREIALQADGKIVVVGWRKDPVTVQDLAVARYNPNGSLDTTFSGDGKLLTNLGGIDSAEGVAIQSNGKIVVGGMRCLDMAYPDEKCDIALVRYLANGALDTTFSGDGKVLTDFSGGSNGFWGGLEIQPDGKIVIAGWMWNGADFDFAAYRHNANGTLDNTFSGDGKVKVGFGSGRSDWATDLALQPDGKILLSGSSCDTIGFTNCNIVVARLNPNGTLDATFSGDGRQVIDYGGNDFSQAIAVQSNGKVVVAGVWVINAGFVALMAVTRLNANGILDTTFSGDGKVLTGFGTGISAGSNDVRIQSNGKIVVAGIAGGDFALVRYNANGTLDTTFSTNGRVRVNFGGDEDGQKLVVQSDGRYVMSGSTQGDFALARVLP